MAECSSSVISQDELRTMVQDLCQEFIHESCIILYELETKKVWILDWLRRRETHGTSSQLLTELRAEELMFVIVFLFTLYQLFILIYYRFFFTNLYHRR